ncbi:AAA family ATPase [Mycobacterium sp. 155]|uniref:AAA family ATPase n=1 Tax=Mycobacterium sp. 155 TaxID=1157943 RepID=UPI000373FDBC|nr:AAA family ATPase [Mycobacterium sp. 155]
MVAQNPTDATVGASAPTPNPNADNTATSIPWGDIAAVGLWQSGIAKCGCAEHRHSADDGWFGGAPVTLHNPNSCGKARGDAELDPRLTRHLGVVVPDGAASVSVPPEVLAGALRGIPAVEALTAVAAEREAEATYTAAGIERIERRLALAAELDARGLDGDLAARLRDQMPPARTPRRYLPILLDSGRPVPRCGTCGRTRPAAAGTGASKPAAASGIPPIGNVGAPAPATSGVPPIGNLGGPAAFTVPPAPGAAPAPGSVPPIGNVGAPAPAAGTVPPAANRPVGPAPTNVPFSESDLEGAELEDAQAALKRDPDDVFAAATIKRHAEKTELRRTLTPYLDRIPDPDTAGGEVIAAMRMTRADRDEAVDAALSGRLTLLDLLIRDLAPTARDAKSAWERVREPETSGDRYVGGGAFIHGIPETTPAIWGSGEDVYWAEGEATIVAGSQGVGKSTLAGNLVLGMITGGMEFLGYPIKKIDRILYLAMDRPKQIARALRRQLKHLDQETIDRHLVIWKGPPPEDLAAHPDRLLAMAEKARATVVIVDSLKDAALGLSSDEVGAGWNRARQTALAAGVEVLELHHDRKANDTSAPMIEKLYGSVWITSGVGSVIHLGGEPGDPVVRMYHLKQPANEVGPFDINHDNVTGKMTIHESVDLLGLCRQPGGVSAKAAAAALYDMERPSPAQVEKARRKLKKLAEEGTVTEAIIGSASMFIST